MNSDNRNNSNSNRKRSARYNNYKGSKSKKVNSHSKNYNKKINNSNDKNFNITKQQVFDFDEMNFSDEIDTSFVENKRKKKEKIIDELAQSYERQKNKENSKKIKEHSKMKIGRLFAVISVLILLLAILIVCIYIVTRPVETKVVTKEKEVVIVDDNYLFLGDSITEQYDLEKYFPDMNVVNSGISGNLTKDILAGLKNRAYQYNPSKVFLLIGTNDIQAGVKEEDIIKNIEEILSELKENRPYAELYLESIYPVDEEKKGALSRTNEEITSINDTLKDYCKKENITFIDMYDLLLDPDEEEDVIKSDYTKDGLHITDDGYEVITKEIMKYIK